MALRDDVDADISVYYETDYERRKDLTDVEITAPTGTSAVNRMNKTVIFKRRPMCRHVRQFALELTAGTAGKGFALVGVDIFYRYTGIERGVIKTPIQTTT